MEEDALLLRLGLGYQEASSAGLRSTRVTPGAPIFPSPIFYRYSFQLTQSLKLELFIISIFAKSGHRAMWS